MPTNTSKVGPHLLPVATTGQDSDLTDPTLLGLLAYFRHWLKDSLDAKLAEMRGPTTSAAITDACPATHVFPWDHAGTFVRPLAGQSAAPLPGLWAWETGSQPSERYTTLLHEVQRRDITVQYIFPELKNPEGMLNRHGLIPAASKALFKAWERGYHPTFTTGLDDDGNPFPVGTMLWRMLRLRGWHLVRGMSKTEAALPGSESVSQGAQRGRGAAKRFFPSLVLQLQVHERVELHQPVDPGDILGDGTFEGLTVGEDEAGDDTPIVIIDRILEGADGN